MHVSPQNSNRNVSNHADVRCDCVSPQCVITQIKTVLETEQPPDAVLFLNERYLVHDVSADPWLARPSRPLEAAELASLATLRYRGIFADDWQQPAQSEESKQAHRDKLLDALLSMFHALVTDCQSLTPTLSSNKPCAYDEMAVRRFFVAISFGYRQGNPFHNFYHAFHVAQTYFALYCTFIHPVDQWEVCDRVAGFFAAFGHDYGHLGVTNSFLVAEEHPLALRYNGISVQEQHHAAMTLHLLSKYRVLEPLRILDLKEYRFVKDTIFQCILTTDVAKHRNFLTELRNARTDETTHNLPNSETRRQLRIRLLVTCSDLSSEIRDEEFSKYWSACLREEFYQQGDLEMRKGGRPASPFRRGETSLAQEQISFIDHLCLPIYTEAVGWFPSMSELVRRLEDKKRIWSQSV